MVKVKSVKEAVENYVLGAAQGMWKFRRYLIRKGVKNPTEKAIKYGVKMVLAGTSDLDKAIWMFRDLAEACNALAKALERVKSKTPKKTSSKTKQKIGNCTKLSNAPCGI